MERIIKRDILLFLQSNNLMKDSQHGFRNKRSCLTHLLEFVERIAEPVDVDYLLGLKK